MPQTYMSSYKGSLTDFLNTCRTSNRNLSYNKGFRRLKITITTTTIIVIVIIIHSQNLDFSTQHHWKTVTVLRQSPPRLPCFPKAQNLLSSLFLPRPKPMSKLAEKLQTCCPPCVPWQCGEPWDHQDQCCKHQSGMAWDARSRQRWQQHHPHSCVSQSLAQTPTPVFHQSDKPALQFNFWFSY